MKILARLRFIGMAFISIAILQACDQQVELKPPHISAQGFAIENVQNGSVGQFGSLRLRIESMARITRLYIKERSYEVDLATTPDKTHSQLFGIKKSARLHTDLTLDFQNYINKKLERAGKYEFAIEVVDKKNQKTHATLLITLEEPKEKATPIESGHFQLKRKGKSQVAGGDKFGISWKTIDDIKVTIRISKAENGASKVAKFNTEEYDDLATKEGLSQKIIGAVDQEIIEFDTANSAAAQEVFGIASLGNYYLLKTNLSKTYLSHIGTTVILDGEYKY